MRLWIKAVLITLARPSAFALACVALRLALGMVPDRYLLALAAVSLAAVVLLVAVGAAYLFVEGVVDAHDRLVAKMRLEEASRGGADVRDQTK